MPGSPDQVDLDVTVTEKPTGNLLAGVGYSSADGVVFTGSVSQNNVFGTGNSLAATFNTSRINRNIALTYVDPYWTAGRHLAQLRALRPEHQPVRRCRSRQYTSETFGAAVGFGIPITETDVITVGVPLRAHAPVARAGSPLIYVDFVREFGSVTNSYIVSAGWSRDTRDSILFPSRGLLQTAYAEMGTPLGDLYYYKTQLSDPVVHAAAAQHRADAAQRAGLRRRPRRQTAAVLQGVLCAAEWGRCAATRRLRWVRRTRPATRSAAGGRSSATPSCSSRCRAPRPRTSRCGCRCSLDAGEIYDNGSQPQFESFRYSTGAGLAWNSPVGPLKFSYGYPLNKKPGDRIQRFQFQVGTVF